jgi:glutathione S-transferase
MLTLYYAPGTCALASLLCLEFARARYRVERLDFANQQQRSDDYLKINPRGRVPALVTEQGTLTETPAILQYIAQTHPEAGLAPLDDPFALARVNEFNSYLCATVHVAHAHGRRGYRWADDEAAQKSMQAKVTQNMADCFAMIEQQMLRGPWVLGERFSISDPYLFTVARWLKVDGVDVNSFPKVAAHLERLGNDPRTRAVMERNAS